MNQQSWHFTVIQNKVMLDNINQAVKDFLTNSPEEHFKQLVNRPDFHVFHNAPTAIIVSGDTKAAMPEADCAAAIENMLVAAKSIGVGSCWVDSVIVLLDNQKCNAWKKELGIPDGYKPVHAISLGYAETDNTQAPPRKANTVNYIK
jgi:nitroreductase